MVTVTCKQCLNTYLVHPYRLPKTKYCSSKCNGDASAPALAMLRYSGAAKNRIDPQQPTGYRLVALPVGSSKVSTEDYDVVRRIHWSRSKTGYVVSGGSRSKERHIMHRLVVERMTGTKLKRTQHVDHINHDKLDNRRENLRVTTTQQNIFNSLPTKGTSHFKGVSWDKRTSKWVGSIHIDRRKIHLGSFQNEPDAALAYDAAAIQLYGDYAWLNFIGR